MPPLTPAQKRTAQRRARELDQITRGVYLCKNEIKRLSLRSSITRISKSLNESVHDVIRMYLYTTIYRAKAFAQYHDRKTIRKADLAQAFIIENSGVFGYL